MKLTNLSEKMLWVVVCCAITYAAWRNRQAVIVKQRRERKRVLNNLREIRKSLAVINYQF
jgi:uncharacterized membrane protein